MKIRPGDIQMSRVLSESEDSLIIEVIKDKNAKIKLDEDVAENRFLSLVFVHADVLNPGAANAKSWVPWEAHA